jgi:hypothetical protein
MKPCMLAPSEAVEKNKRSEPPVLQLKIRGPGIRRGRISVPDLIKLCEEAQNAVNKQAEALKGKKTIHPGPTAQNIQQECTLELIGIRGGSTTLQFGLARPQLLLNFGEENREFSSEVIGELASTIRSLGNGNKKSVDPGVLMSVYSLSSVVQSKRISRLEWIAPRHGGRRKMTAAVNTTVRERAAARLSSPRKERVQVDGTLDMADFKPKERRCRIDPPVGASIMCTFDEGLEDEIYGLLRKPVRVSGEAVFQPYVDRIDSLHIETIKPLASLALGADNFLAQRSINELAKMQKVRVIRDLSSLAGGIPEDQDIDELLGEIYGTRK